MTVTSNIFYNLTAWASGQTTAIGANVSSNGVAWRATTAGTTGSTAPSGTNPTFNDGGVTWKRLANIDYTSINSWQSGIPATLTEPVVGLLWAVGEIVINSQVLITGHTTSSTNTITLKCAPGESFRDLFTRNTPLRYTPTIGVAIKFTSPGYGQIFRFDTSNGIVDGIQFSIAAYRAGASFQNENYLVSNCIMIGSYRSNCISANNAFIYNCLFINGGGDGGATGAGYNCKWASCTFVSPSDLTYNNNSGVYGAYTPAYLDNCIVMGYVDKVAGGGRGNVFNYCATDLPTYIADGNETATNSLVSQSYVNTFVGTTTSNLDFRLKPGSPVIDKGYTDNRIPASDIIGTSRYQGANWDMGAWEMPQAGFQQKSIVYIIS